MQRTPLTENQQIRKKNAEKRLSFRLMQFKEWLSMEKPTNSVDNHGKDAPHNGEGKC